MRIGVAQIRFLRSVARTKIRGGNRVVLKTDNIKNRISDYRSKWWERVERTE